MNIHNKTFSAIQTAQDISKLVGFSISELDYAISHKDEFYSTFYEPKKDGTKREINAPKKYLKNVQRRLKDEINKLSWPQYVQGGVKERSIITNAQLHCKKDMVATMDVKNFFPSITVEKLCPALIRTGFGNEAAKFLTELGTYKNHLPQGTPTSTCLANLTFLEVDKKFLELCSRHRLRYSRYVDDLTISGNRDLRTFRDSFIKFITSDGYEVADSENKKLKFTGRDKPQIVNSLVVNDKVRPTKEYVSELKKDIRKAWTDEGMTLLADSCGKNLHQMHRNLWGRCNFLELFITKKDFRALRGLMVKATSSYNRLIAENSF